MENEQTLESNTSNAPTQEPKTRCPWTTNDLLAQYHDDEWGDAVHDDTRLLEMLCLEGVQSGLSWFTVLQRRDAYRELFFNFDAEKMASLDDVILEEYAQDARIIRNRLKVYGFRKNAIAYLNVKEKYGSFDSYIWQFVEGTTIVNRLEHFKDARVTSKESDAMAKDLKSKGFTFIGSSICYAYMQAVGMVSDHVIDCWKCPQ